VNLFILVTSAVASASGDSGSRWGELDRTYPRPIVSHAIAREVALEAFSRIRGEKHGQQAIDVKGGVP
jgi:hypothetical protein